MPGYWERVIASYTEGKMRFGMQQRFLDGGSDTAIFDSSHVYGGKNFAGSFDMTIFGIDVAYMVPFINPVKAAFSLQCVQVNLPQPGAAAKFAIYEDQFLNGYPSQFKLYQPTKNLPSAPCTFSGLTGVAFVPNLELPQGFFWLAVRFNDIIGIEAYDVSDIAPIGGYDVTAWGAPEAKRCFALGIPVPAFADPWDDLMDVYAINSIVAPPLIPRIGMVYTEMRL